MRVVIPKLSSFNNGHSEKSSIIQFNASVTPDVKPDVKKIPNTKHKASKSAIIERPKIPNY
jgi:hypothetical protein